MNYPASAASHSSSKSVKGKRVLVAMSGGVDSSVAAALLKNEGYDVIGVHMQLWDQGEVNVERFGGRCCSLVDSNDARRVCDKIDVPYYVINAQDVFKEKVVDYFVHEYLQNRTPNPCVQCNNQIKFNYLYQKADELDCQLVATGHYAQVAQDPVSGFARLHKGTDPNKDQTYFLFGLTQQALTRTLMPLGGLPKMMVRKLAEEFGLTVAQKADSQEICFIGEEGYKAFIEKRSTPELRPRGVIRSVDGRVMGEHYGLHRYTIGQRKGLQLTGKDTEEFFVVGFDHATQGLVVGPESHLFHKELFASQMNWIRPMDELKGIQCKARIRSRHEEAACRVTSFENNVVHVEFEQPQRAITPGQAIVFYEGDEVLGGAFIDRLGKHVNSYLVRTLGCKANLYDSQLLEAELQKRGWSPLSTEVREPGGDSETLAGESAAGRLLCIVNSCTVTDEADRQTRKMASRLFREHPQATVVVTGCGAEVDPERMARSPGIHYVIGNRDKPGLVNRILERLESGARPMATAHHGGGEVLGRASGYEELLSRHPMDREWPQPEESFFTPPVALPGQSRKTRAFLKIQEGCNSFCTYCIIPYGRGPGRSLRPREVLSQIRELVAQGVREVVITGTNIGDYGSDWSDPVQAPSAEPPLTELFELILTETELERLRVSSLDPVEITPGLLSLMQRDSRFCPHFHVSLQSPNSKILRLMKRKYAQAEVKSCLERIQEIPGSFVGMDVITGFPGETLADFEEGVEALKRLPWSRLHVFPFSERAGTPATRLPGAVPQGERLRRARLLNALSLERVQAVYGDVLKRLGGEGTIERVLLERPQSFQGRRWLGGYSPGYLRVLLPLDCGLKPNDLVSVVPIEVGVDANSGDAVFIARPA